MDPEFVSSSKDIMITIVKRRKWSHFLSRLINLTETDVRVIEKEHLQKKINGILFRYGVVCNVKADAYINSNDSILIDKAKARQIMQRHKIPIPPTVYDTKSALALLKNGHILIGRPRHHFGGNHFYVIKSKRKLLTVNSKCDYYSVLLPKDAEFRVFTLLGYVIGVAEKVKPEDDDIRWNHRHGAVFQNVRFSQWDRRLVLMALETAYFLGLDFTAVDIIKVSNRYYVLEANKAPALESDYRLSVFARCLDYINRFYDENHHLPRRERISHLPRWKEIIFPALLSNPINGWRR